MISHSPCWTQSMLCYRITLGKGRMPHKLCNATPACHCLHKPLAQSTDDHADAVL